MATENLDLGVDSFGQVEDKSGTWCGVMLLLLFLFFDSFTSQWQSRMFSKHEYVVKLVNPPTPPAKQRRTGVAHQPSPHQSIPSCIPPTHPPTPINPPGSPP